MNGSVMTRTLKVLIDPKQILLIFFNIFTGMQQAYFAADFTASFVSCAIGVGIVGFVMMTYGLVDAIGSVTVGQLAKKVGRLPLMIAAFVTHCFILVFLLSWSPQSNQKFVVYILACLWGLCDSVWMVQSSVFYGIIFADRKEAAFSSIRFYESIGFVIAYFMSPYLRTNVKTFILLLTMVIGVVLYFVLEYKEKKFITLNTAPQLNSPNMELDFCDQSSQNKKSKSSMSDGDTVL
ncbi:putative UNC93A protein [Danaus plexippus plexippus]|uniref:UNC93A protein n=1 Tax=Danaus plexippus plexippus TaxID=278856 RepID=A0A212EPF5_DANPL|nr:putative UNC93A protein [Danaus plexippus plexippus]